MDEPLQQVVRSRAQALCEYCCMPEAETSLPFVIDHVIARQHGGRTEPDNVALACGRCNLCKGPNIAGIDPKAARLVRLFNPRTDRWPDHFEWQGAVISGRTPIGRTTAAVLALNQPGRVRLR